MARPTIEPVTVANLEEFCGFLRQHLNPAMSLQAWRAGLGRSWHMQPPNHGLMLRDQGQIVGGIGAIYAERLIGGKPERFCNITSWCVLESHRQQSMRLAMALTSQLGFHFTDFSPTQVVGQTLRFLKFQPLEERRALMLNLPALPGVGAGQVVAEADRIAQLLGGEDLQAYLDHRDLPWLRHALVGQPGAWCYVVYKPRYWKRLRCASVLHISNRRLFDIHLRAFGGHLLARGTVVLDVEARLLERVRHPARVQSGFNAKLFRSETLEPAQMDVLYSETVALDL